MALQFLLLTVTGAAAADAASEMSSHRVKVLEAENARLRLLLARSNVRPRWQSPAAGSLKASKPNILLVFGDDVGYADLGAFGHPTARTPNLDQMAATGAKLTQYYSAANICSPSRGSLMVLFLSRHRASDNLPSFSSC
eukprot:SAG11_NODE_505_length_8888_cov_12.479235_12_plen_139_part_00